MSEGQQWKCLVRLEGSLTRMPPGDTQQGRSVGVGTGVETEVVKTGQTGAGVSGPNLEAVRFVFLKKSAGQIKYIFRPD